VAKCKHTARQTPVQTIGISPNWKEGMIPVIDSFSQLAFAIPQSSADDIVPLVEKFMAIANQTVMPPEARFALTRSAIALLTLRRERLRDTFRQGERPEREKVMDKSTNTTSFDPDYFAEGVTRGLRMMKQHLEAGAGGGSDDVVDSCARELDRTWPIQKALEDLYEIAPGLRSFVIPDEEATTTSIDPTIVLAVLAGRMFVAGCEVGSRPPAHVLAEGHLGKGKLLEFPKPIQYPGGAA